MFFFSKFKQKISKIILTRSQKSYLTVLLLVLMFVFLYPHSALAIDDPITWAVKLLLKAVLQFCALLLSMAETIFKWIVNADNMKAIMDNEVVYSTWRTVRDFFNVAFIMVLLFSAFATIFQAPTNFNYKKILLNLVIMALLVNFSYPIARFIVDASNMMMFGILKNLDGSNSFMVIIKKSELGNIFTAGKNADLLYLLSAIVFTFIYAVTLLVIAVLLTIRTIAITIYIIFSPIAFIGPIVPGTAVASAGNDWWKDFMKYCFSGPTMIFMLFIATRMMVAVTDSQIKMGEIAMTQVPGDESTGMGSLITSASKFSLPIVILWIGIIQAQKSGIAGAGAVVAMGTKAINKAGKWAAGAPAGAAWWAAKKTGVPGGVQQKWAQFKKSGSDRQAEREARVAGALGVPRVQGQMQAKRVKEAGESHDVTNREDLDLEGLAASSDKFESAAAIMELAARGLADNTQLDNVRQQFGDNSQVTRQLENKMKPYAADAVFTKNGVLDEAGLTRYMQSDNFNPEKLGAAALGNARLMDIGLRTGTINNDNLEKSRKKSPEHERAIVASLASAASATDLQDIAGIEAARNAPGMVQGSAEWIDLDNQLRTARKVQTAHFAQTGKFHAGVNQASRADIISRLNADTAKRIHSDTTGNASLMNEFVENLDPGKLKAIIMANDGPAQSAILNATRTNAAAAAALAANPNSSARGARNLRRVNGDTELQSMA
jgi:hypothetical protein